MHWKAKAYVQQAVSLLPSRLSYESYYWMQRRFGGLGNVEATRGFFVAAETWKRLKRLGRDPVDKTFFEVGTGRVPAVPLAFYLMGARKTTTLDLNPYLVPELVERALQDLASRPDQARSLLEPFLDKARWSRLMSLIGRMSRMGRKSRMDRVSWTSRMNRMSRGKGRDTCPGTLIDELLDLCAIEYLAPGDAASTPLASGSMDFHMSNTALEHIPAATLARILAEGNRILRDDGVFIHRVDYTDHFSHSDHRLSPINFLRYSDKAWARYAGNRYMYMNRLRHDDMLAIFRSAGCRMLLDEPEVDPRVLEALRAEAFAVHPRFAAKPHDVLATTAAWIAAAKAPRRASQAPRPRGERALEQSQRMGM